MHVPEAYLAAVVQTAARKNQWPLDKVSLSTEVTHWQHPGSIASLSRHPSKNAIDALDDIDESVQGYHLIEGLHLEGAGWDLNHGCLTDPSAKQLVFRMPLIKIIPTEAHRVHRINALPTPVYVTSDRRNALGVGWVFEAHLPTTRDLSHWILNGVCLLLNTD